MNASNLAFLTGAIAGMLATVRLFMMLAGVTFTHWRQVLAAYLAAMIAATFIVATGSADGGPPNFADVPNQWLGATIAAICEVAWLHRRQGA